MSTILLLGGDSPHLYRNAIDRLDAALPDSSVVILPGQQHIAHLMNAELLAKEVLQFVRSRSDGSRAELNPHDVSKSG